MTPATAIRTLIAQAETWRTQHLAAGHGIDAAACSVRIRDFDVVGGDRG